MSKIIITSNKNPDLDGYACSVGYAEYLNKTGKDSEPILLNEIDDETKFVLDFGKIRALEKNKKDISKNKIVIVDTSNLNSLKLEIAPNNLIEIIDHRRINDSYLYPWVKTQIEMVGSCATLIAEKFINDKIEPSRESRLLLYSAVISNTINFKNKITTDRDIKAAQYLSKEIDLPKNSAEQMFRARTNIEGENLNHYLNKDYIEQTVCNKSLTVFQMEIVETSSLVRDRLKEIITIIKNIIKNKKLDYCFLNIIDTLEAYNYIVVVDAKSEDFLRKVLNLNFENGLAKTDFIIMRKEIMVKIKEYLENNGKVC
jgi:manganese-dependent inorganic pyrophosphatase